MNYPKVSVIVPVYNVAKYLPQCLDSLAAQTLKNIEIVLINDGSTDSSSEILRDYIARCPTFRLIEQENKGSSEARNTGLKVATGEFIGFVDADDWVEPQMFEELLKMAEKNDADIAQCSFSMYMENDKTSQTQDMSWIPALLKHTGGRLRGGEMLLFDDVTIWKKIYRRSLFASGQLLFYKSMEIGEDISFHLIALCLANKIYANNQPYYHYRKQRPEQLTLMSDRRLFAFFQSFTIMDDFLCHEKMEYLRPWMLHLQLSRHCYGYKLASIEIKPEYFQRIRQSFIDQGIGRRDHIPAGPWYYGGIANRVRYLLLIFLHPMILRAVLNNDRKSFDRVIQLSAAYQRWALILGTCPERLWHRILWRFKKRLPT